MNIYLAWAIAIGYWIGWPIYLTLKYLGLGLLIVLRPILSLILILFQPFVYVGLAIGHLSAWPFRFLARFETLYIYLGAGGIVGLLCGAILYFSQDLMASNLRLHSSDRDHDIIRPAKGPTAREHRQARNESTLRTINGLVMMPPKIFVHDSPSKSMGRNGLVAQTIIHEEVDSDF